MSALALSSKLTKWFEHTQDNPPAILDPLCSMGRHMDAVIEAMLRDKYYDTHTRVECAAEFRRRYQLALALAN